MAWIWDAPSGVYKNHTLSKKLREAALANTQFTLFPSPEPGYGKGKGESVTITRLFQLPLGTRVSETERLPSGRPAIDTVAIVPAEWGFKIELTEFEKHLTHFDIENKFQKLLRNQMSLTLDKMVADAYKATTIKYRTTSTTAGNFSTTGTPDGIAQANLAVAHLRQIYDYLAGDLKCPYYKEGKYVGILSTKAARGLKNDVEYREWLSPTTSEPFTSGRLKDIEGFMLYETNHFNALANSIGASGVAGEAIFFGEDAVSLAEILTPEVRAGLPEDLGRFREVGWYGIVEAALVWGFSAADAGNARVVHFTSA